MQALYLAYFESSAALFRHDLQDKDEALLLFHDGELAGFTLWRLYATTWQGQEIRVVYSGDTIVAQPHWGQQALALAWLARMGQIRQQEPQLSLYWFLLVKGHRTYKYLPVFGRSFFPHWSSPEPGLRTLAAYLAHERFGHFFDANAGVVHFPSSRGHLKQAVAEPSSAEMAKPATQFFLKQNPGFRSGDELVCLCRLDADNMKPLAARVFARACVHRP